VLRREAPACPTEACSDVDKRRVKTIKITTG
jgi:hypothetical protein